MTTTVVTNNDPIIVGVPSNELLPEMSSSIYQLVVQHQPPTFVYIGEPFNIDFIVVEEVVSLDSEGPSKSDAPSQKESTDITPLPAARKQNVTTGTGIGTGTSSRANNVEPVNSKIPSFEIVTELLPIATDVSIDPPNVPPINISTNTTIIKNPNAVSRFMAAATPSQQQRHTKPTHFVLNVLQNPSPISLGEFGTIQCSITGNNLHYDNDSKEQIISPHQQKRDGIAKLSSLSSSSSKKPIPTLLYDASQIFYQIRIVAYRFGSDDEINNQRRNETEVCPFAFDPSLQLRTKSTTFAVTSSIAIVFYKILITSCNNEGSSHGSNTSKNQMSTEKDWNPVWYKDEGGRDKCMEIIVGVYDRKQMALFETIPLLLTLCYASSNQQSMKQSSISLSPQLPIPVTNQDILNVLSPKPNERFVIDRATGTMKIRFRVEDVSKNHQGQDFCLLIAAALENDSCSYLQTYIPSMFAPAISLSINVRSKRNKRPRQFSTLSSNLSMPASDISSEHVHRYRTAVMPTVDTVLSPNMSAAAMVENHPNITVLQVQYALRSVIQWVDEVVRTTTTTYELQRSQAHSDIPKQYWSSLSQSLSVYHSQVREQLNLLQSIILCNAASPTNRSPTSLLDPNHPYGMYYNARDSMHQHPSLAAADHIRYHDVGLGHYQPPLTSYNSSPVYPQTYPYLYQNQPCHVPRQTYQHRATANNDSRSVPVTAYAPTNASTATKPYGSYGYMYSTSEHNYPEDESGIAENTNKRQFNIPEAFPRNRSQPYPSSGKKVRSKIAVEANYRGSVEDSRQNTSSEEYEVQDKLSCEGIKGNLKEVDVIKEHEQDDRENEVEYVFAKQFKSLRTGALLGYPAYTINKELIGFYHQLQSTTHPVDLTKESWQRPKPSLEPSPIFPGNHTFVPVQTEDFGKKELEHAKVVLDQADRSAIQSMSQYGSIETMLHCALVYEWSEGISNG